MNEEAQCRSCKHDGNQNQYPSGCTGCMADGKEYQNYKPRNKMLGLWDSVVDSVANTFKAPKELVLALLGELNMDVLKAVSILAIFDKFLESKLEQSNIRVYKEFYEEVKEKLAKFKNAPLEIPMHTLDRLIRVVKLHGINAEQSGMSPYILLQHFWDTIDSLSRLSPRKNISIKERHRATGEKQSAIIGGSYLSDLVTWHKPQDKLPPEAGLINLLVELSDGHFCEAQYKKPSPFSDKSPDFLLYSPTGMHVVNNNVVRWRFLVDSKVIKDSTNGK